jgi:hypothetical protein
MEVENWKLCIANGKMFLENRIFNRKISIGFSFVNYILKVIFQLSDLVSTWHFFYCILIQEGQFFQRFRSRVYIDACQNYLMIAGYIFVMAVSPMCDLTRNAASKCGKSLISTGIHSHSKLALEMYTATPPPRPSFLSQHLDTMREKSAMSIESGSHNKVSVRMNSFLLDQYCTEFGILFRNAKFVSVIPCTNSISSVISRVTLSVCLTHLKSLKMLSLVCAIFSSPCRECDWEWCHGDHFAVYQRYTS